MDKLNNDSRSEKIDTKIIDKQKDRPNIRAVSLKDRQNILKWINEHDLIGFTGLPKIGFCTDSVACFLNQGECGIATIDHLVKKPNSTDNTLEGVYCVLACVEYARQHDYKLIHAVSSIKHIVSFSENLGFKIMPHNLLAMEL